MHLTKKKWLRSRWNTSALSSFTAAFVQQKPSSRGRSTFASLTLLFVYFVLFVLLPLASFLTFDVTRKLTRFSVNFFRTFFPASDYAALMEGVQEDIIKESKEGAFLGTFPIYPMPSYTCTGRITEEIIIQLRSLWYYRHHQWRKYRNINWLDFFSHFSRWPIQEFKNFNISGDIFIAPEEYRLYRSRRTLIDTKFEWFHQSSNFSFRATLHKYLPGTINSLYKSWRYWNNLENIFHSAPSLRISASLAKLFGIIKHYGFFSRATDENKEKTHELRFDINFIAPSK